MTLERKRERAWRVTRKLGSLVILAERESAWRITRKHLKELEKEMGWMAGCCIGPY